MVETGDHELVLGQNFLNSVKFSQEYKPGGIFGTITHPSTHQSAVFRTLAPQDLAKRTESLVEFGISRITANGSRDTGTKVNELPPISLAFKNLSSDATAFSFANRPDLLSP